MTQKKCYDTDYEVSKIQTFIIEFKENKIKELEDEMKKKLTIKVYKLFKKCFTKLQKMKYAQSKIKPIKTGKELGATYCLGCKDFSHNFRPKKVKMKNNK